MYKVLFICTGNTCRSPMAEALLKAMAVKAELSDKVAIKSAGISAWGQPASSGAKAAMRLSGLDLDKHCSKQVAADDIRAADLVLTMTNGHKRVVCSMAPAAVDKIYTLAEFAGESGEVSDPFGGSEAHYRQCAGEIERLLAKCWQKIVAAAGN